MNKFSAFAFTLCLGLLGCGGAANGPQEYSVSGKVNFNGQPVETGRILFREVEGDQRAFSGEIKNGSYQLTAEPGKMRVEILASRPVPGKFDNSNGTPEPVGEMYIPEQYNTKSELTAEVTGSGKNTISFDLTDKK